MTKHQQEKAGEGRVVVELSVGEADCIQLAASYVLATVDDIGPELRAGRDRLRAALRDRSQLTDSGEAGGERLTVCTSCFSVVQPDDEGGCMCDFRGWEKRHIEVTPTLAYRSTLQAKDEGGGGPGELASSPKSSNPEDH